MAEIPDERGDNARDRYRAEIETGRSLLRLRPAGVVLRRMRGMVGVPIVVCSRRVVIAHDVWMRVWVRVWVLMAMDGTRLV